MRDRQALREHLRGAFEEGQRGQRLEVRGVAIEIAFVGRLGHCLPRTRIRGYERGAGGSSPSYRAKRCWGGFDVRDQRKAKKRNPTKVTTMATPTPAAMNSGRIAGSDGDPEPGRKLHAGRIDRVVHREPGRGDDPVAHEGAPERRARVRGR